MSDVRVCSGTALWTSVFTPPTRRNRSAPVVDLSGNYNGGNFSTKDMTDVATYRDGQVIEPVASAVWDFDGTDDTIKIATSSSVQLNTASISFWVYFKAYDAGDLIQMAIGSGSYAQWYVRSNPLSWNYYFQGGYYVNKNLTSAEQSAFFPLNTWLNVCWVFDKKSGGDAESSVYVNGVEAFSLAAASSGSVPWGTAGMTVGGYTWDGFTETKIAQYAMYNKVLTTSQIKQSFNAQCNRFKVGPPAIVRSGLQLELDAAKYSGSGSTWYDLSGNNYNITLVGSPTWNSNGYFDFNGSSQFGYHTFASAIGTQTAVTTEVWVNADTISGWDSMFDMHNDDYLVALLNGQLAFYDPTHYSGYTVSTGTWYQLVVAYNSAGTSYFYANGVSVGSFTSTTTHAPTIISVAAGYSSPSAGNEYFDGQMAMLNWYNRQLTAAEVGNNFQAGRERFAI
jgi:hypothetical protein